jgi:hypothetical protein
MIIKTKSILSKLLRREDGQMLAFTALIMVSIMGMSGIALDAGHVYYAYERLKAATNAATLAGAAGLPDTSTATSNVTAYSAQTGELNSLGALMTNVQANPSFSCSKTVSSTFNVPCETSSGGTGGNNAITVTQTATVPTWFGCFFGVCKFNIAAQAMAAMKGGSNTPWNIAIILDTTASMGDPDSGLQCSGTQIQCAIQGVQDLLLDLNPCPTGVTCSSSATYVDDVALYVFPPVSTNNASFDYCANTKVGSTTYKYSSGSQPTHGYYVVPTVATGYTYQIIDYSHDYKTTGGASTLATGSNIVKAVGYSGSSCTGIQAPGGAGTYYAQVIQQAQADLLTEQTGNPTSQNAMILLSDGNATADPTPGSSVLGKATCSGGSGGYCTANYPSSADILPSTNGSLYGVTGNGPTTTTYPSAVGECGQAVLAAQAATKVGTKVYTVGYGAPSTGSSANCQFDQSYTGSGNTTYGGGAWPGNKSPCAALAAMASDGAHFFSDDADGCAATNNVDFTKLTQIFTAISSSLTSARLIPVGTT